MLQNVPTIGKERIRVILCKKMQDIPKMKKKGGKPHSLSLSAALLQNQENCKNKENVTVTVDCFGASSTVK
ncbi:MAG: hypothetical protein K6E40_05730 [Desulfovibrio sp.]|nr:hypothetical protein [Desulfovibrio sp.]